MTNDRTTSLVLRGIAFSADDIQRVVSSFYRQVQIDPLLRIPFQTVDDWPHHIEKLTHFWWIRFGGKPYLDVSYDPVGKHFETGFNEHFLERWLELFKSTLQKELRSDQAGIWYEFAEAIGVALTRNNELMHIRAQSSR